MTSDGMKPQDEAPQPAAALDDDDLDGVTGGIESPIRDSPDISGNWL